MLYEGGIISINAKLKSGTEKKLKEKRSVGKIDLQNIDCLKAMKYIADKSIGVILTDPPYLYLKGQKLDREFDEQMFFSECKRVLKKDGFIVLFGRGESFYRWNTILISLGFKFKEEFIWDKGYCTSPLMSISRVHETISVFTNGNGTLNKIKVPYLEMKQHDLNGIITDIKRLKTTFKNTKSLDAVITYLEENKRDTSDSWNANMVSISSDITKEDRSVSVMRSIKDGMNEKTVIRSDRYDTKTFTRHGVNADERQSGDRCVNVINSITQGMNEKTIIEEGRDHYNTIHPTQKPVRLLIRLLRLTAKESDTILDPFGGSFSTMEAVYTLGFDGISFEIDKEYFEIGKKRIDELQRQHKLF